MRAGRAILGQVQLLNTIANVRGERRFMSSSSIDGAAEHCEEPMRLAEFILRNMEAILAQWETFAATQLPAAANMKRLALRDHAQQILEAVSKDLGTVQSRDAQAEKSVGRAPVLIDAPETAAETHAILRARSGFNIKQLAAEYRALRASVLRLWIDACHPQAAHPEDMMRFNEAID